MRALNSVCVYCGSASQVDEVYKQAAHDLGSEIGRDGLRLVYGGGRVGLMGIVADAALAQGAEVIGIIPEHIQRLEVEHTGLTELHVVDTMHVRKAMMVAQSNAFIILPGGIGTLDEAFEIITWRQLKLHDKPVVIVNVGGFWDPLLALLDHLETTGFLRKPNLSAADHGLYRVVDRVADVLPLLRAEPDPTVPDRISKL